MDKKIVYCKRELKATQEGQNKENETQAYHNQTAEKSKIKRKSCEQPEKVRRYL